MSMKWVTNADDIADIIGQHVCRHLKCTPLELSAEQAADIKSTAKICIDMGGPHNDEQINTAMRSVDMDGFDAMHDEAMSTLEDQLISSGIFFFEQVRMASPKIFPSLHSPGYEGE